MNSAGKTWRRLARDTRGTEIAETAVVLPMLFMILMGIFWFGQAFRIYGTLTQATRAGARAAVAPVCATCAAGATTPAAGCPSRGSELNGRRASEYESTCSDPSMDDAGAIAVQVRHYGPFVRCSCLRRQRHHQRLCSTERPIVLPNQWAAAWAPAAHR